MEKFIAHINEMSEIQGCRTHCRNSAMKAADDLKSSGLYFTGYLAALLHDCGKFTQEFTDYISHAAQANTRNVKIIHSFAGVNYALNKYHSTDGNISFKDITAEIIADAIGNHHGLFDICDGHSNGFLHRMKKQEDYDARAVKNFFEDCAPEKEIDELFSKAVEEITAKAAVIDEISKTNGEISFYIGLLCRLVSSAVMDGDRKDTAEFMTGKSYEISRENLWNTVCENIESYLSKFKNDTQLNRARSEMSDICLELSEKKGGVFRINIPTGGGKTLTTLRYAAAHCRKHGKSRIYYVAPLISILEQNADVIRKAVGMNELILEHHSNVIDDSENSEDVSLRDFLTDTWDSPVIVTTLVQFLNTCFLSKTSSVRRFQSLCDSVIIIDEVQTVPDNMLSLFNLTVNFLAEICNSTVILCSATQPNLDKTEHSVRISEESEMLNRKLKKYAPFFKRTLIQSAGAYRLEEIPEYVLSVSRENNSVLVICNKKSQSEFIFHNLKSRTDAVCFHLSSSMCIAHRRAVLEEMTEALGKGEKVICVSTQVIEAGVDISFSSVIRFSAGLDSIVQAAGRCNRNSEYRSDSPVYIINCKDESLKMLTQISEGKNATNDLLEEFRLHPQKYEDSIASDKSVSYYYDSLYRNKGRKFGDYPIKDDSTIFEMLSSNVTRRRNEDVRFFLGQAFKTAGSLFEAIDNNARSVIVPYGEGGELIGELSSLSEYDFKRLNELTTQAKQYCVTLYDYKFEELKSKGIIFPLCDSLMYALSDEYYDIDTGVTVNTKEMEEKKTCSIQML